jgi:hypothetical protein
VVGIETGVDNRLKYSLGTDDALCRRHVFTVEELIADSVTLLERG